MVWIDNSRNKAMQFVKNLGNAVGGVKNDAPHGYSSVFFGQWQCGETNIYKGSRVKSDFTRPSVDTKRQMNRKMKKRESAIKSEVNLSQNEKNIEKQKNKST